MRKRAVRGVGVVVLVAVCVAAAACTFSTKGAGGDAATPEYATGSSTSQLTSDADAGAK